MLSTDRTRELQGFSITALHVPTPSSIVSIRYYPQRTDTSSSIFSSSSSLPYTYPSDTADTPKLIISGLPLDKNQSDVVPPCVEVDIANFPAIMTRKMDAGEEGKQREVTIGFYFLEALLAE